MKRKFTLWEKSASVFMLFLILGFAAYAFGLRYNSTDSMPMGFYFEWSVSRYSRGDDVIVELPQHIAMFGAERGYLMTGSTKLVKRLIAVPGDNVVLTDKYIEVNGKSYYAPTHRYDLSHRKLHFLKRGDYNNTKGYWLYGVGNKKESWDSRYFGPVKKSDIAGRAIPLITF